MKGKFFVRILSVMLTLVLLVTTVTVAMVPAQAGLISNLLTGNYTAIALGTVERVTATAVANAASLTDDDEMAEILSWTSRIISGYQSVVNKTLIAETEAISQQLDEMYSLAATEFATINDKLNQIIQEDAADDFEASRKIVTGAGDKYQSIIKDFDNYLEAFIAYNNDSTDENRQNLEYLYNNLCIDYKYVLNVNGFDTFEDETFVNPMTDGGFLSTVSPYNYNQDIYYADGVADVTDNSHWGSEDMRTTYLDALYDYASSVYNFENNVYDLMSSGVNEAADAISMYVQAYRYYVDFNIHIINSDETLSQSEKDTLTGRLEDHFEEYSLKAIRALNQMCQEYSPVLTTYMRSYDTVSTVTLKDYQYEANMSDAYSGYSGVDVPSDQEDRVMQTTLYKNRQNMEVYQFRLVNESSNTTYAIRTTSDGKTTSDNNYFPVSYAAEIYGNSEGTFSLDLLNFVKGTTNGLACIDSLSNIGNIYSNNTSYVDSDTLINNIRRELGISHSSLSLNSVNPVDASANPGAYMLIDSEITWDADNALFNEEYADMTWIDVSKIDPKEVSVDAYDDVYRGPCKDTQLYVMYKGTPKVSLDVNAVSVDGVSSGTGEVYIDGNHVISDNGSASNLESSKAMTLKITPDEDCFVSSIVIKNSSGATLSTIYSGTQEDFECVLNHAGDFELCMPVPAQDTVIEVTYEKVKNPYTVTLSTENEGADLVLDGYEGETQKVYTEGDTVKVSAVPQDTYTISGITVIDANGNTVSATEVSADNLDETPGKKTYTFIMPDSDVTVQASAYVELGYDYIISNYEELCQMREAVMSGDTAYTEARYILDADIYCPDGEEWLPIDVSGGFNGSLDGRGYTIENLTVTDTSLEKVGLFASVGENGTVKNLGLKNLDITAGANGIIGGIAAENSGRISNCYTTGTITVADTTEFSEDNTLYIGGIIAENEGIITNCHNACDIYAGNGLTSVVAGGVTGINLALGSIDGCYNTGNMEAYAVLNVLGGVSGINSNLISNTYNEGDITTHGWINVGGICGYAFKGVFGDLVDIGNVRIRNCYNTGDISVIEFKAANADMQSYYDEFLAQEGETQYIGSLIGQAEKISVYGCYNMGEVTKLGENLYEVCGRAVDSVTLDNYYYLVADGSDITDETQKYMAQFESGEVAYLLNFGVTDGTQVWYQNIDNGLPADGHPVFNGGTVYKVDREDKTYSNLLEEETPVERFTVTFVDKDGNVLSEQTVEYGQAATAPEAPAVDGYTFTGWSEDYEYVTNDITVKAEYKKDEAPAEPAATGKLKIVITGGTGFTISLNGGVARPQGTSYMNTKMEMATSVTVVASTTNGNEFMGWMNAITGAIVSTSETYTFTTSGNDFIQAMYKTDVETVNLVIFNNDRAAGGLGQVMDMQYYAAGDEIVFPGDPALPGYDFAGWNMTEEQIQAELAAGNDVTVTPTWTAREVYVKVTVTGGEMTQHGATDGNGGYLYNKAITVVADDAPENKKFAYWVDQNNEIRSYNAEYKFYAYFDVDLTAVYVDITEIIDYKVIVGVSADPTVDDVRIGYSIFWEVPEEIGTFVQGGVIVVEQKNYNEETFVVGGNAIDSNVAQGVPSAAQVNPLPGYTMNNTNSFRGTSWYARSWVQYTDTNGELQTVYSDMISVDKV